MASRSKDSEAMRRAVRVGEDGVEFFRRANRLASDPRAKFVFGRAADEYGRAASIVKPHAKGKKDPEVPDLFPFRDYAEIECYVCGYTASAEDLPDTCPSCGAAGYAFEREVSPDNAWELVAKTTKKALAFLRKLAKDLSAPKAKAALTEAIGVGKALLAEAEEHRARGTSG